MSEFKGTKGEWKEDIGIDILSNDLHQIIVYSKHVNTHNIAHVFAFNQAEATANAKLIMCAPDMLQMLIRAEQWILNCSEEAKIVTDIKQLIKKATEI